MPTHTCLPFLPSYFSCNILYYSLLLPTTTIYFGSRSCACLPACYYTCSIAFLPPPTMPALPCTHTHFACLHTMYGLHENTPYSPSHVSLSHANRHACRAAKLCNLAFLLSSIISKLSHLSLNKNFHEKFPIHTVLWKFTWMT